MFVYKELGYVRTINDYSLSYHKGNCFCIFTTVSLQEGYKDVLYCFVTFWAANIVRRFVWRERLPEEIRSVESNLFRKVIKIGLW